MSKPLKDRAGRIDPLVIAALVAIVAMVVSYLNKVLPAEHILVAIFFSASLVVLAFFVAWLVLKQTFTPAFKEIQVVTDESAKRLDIAVKSLTETTRRLESLLDVIRRDYRGLLGIVNDEELKTYEREAIGEVWIATRDMLYDLGPFLPILKQNIKRGVKYKYLLADTFELLNKFRELRREASVTVGIESKSTDLMEARKCRVSDTDGITPGKSDMFPFIYECGIYSPRDVLHRRGFIVVPELRSEFNFLLTPDMSLRLVEVFEAYWRRAEPVD
jgi:hypothetical protein